MLTILSNDPGASIKVAGYGYAVVQVRRKDKRLACRILENGVVPMDATITQLKDSKLYLVQREAYLKFMGSKMKAFPGIQAIVAERYMSRGRMGATGEYVNHMLGALGTTYPNLPVKWMSAASWKNAVRRSDVDLDYTYKIVRTTKHQLDACLQGIWAACFAFKEKDFGSFQLKKLLPGLLDQIEATSTAPLHNRKIKRKK